MNTIEMHGVSKRYRLGASATRYATLRESLGATFRREGHQDNELWALRDLDLNIPEGESIGVVGANGAGKTTLLKILARITEPTKGVARTRGSVGALLEVGAGFHSELTGRENIFLNGAILGMTRADVRQRFDEIVSFAGVERFLDTPLKRYSSGMHMRLAFSVAAHLEPDIMLVDEVLAVGDIEFQRRCIGKISELEGRGRTVVFVSHDLGAIGRSCSRAIWLDGGSIRGDGPSHAVLDQYLRSALPAVSTIELDEPAGHEVQLRSVGILNDEGRPSASLRRDRPFSIQARFKTRDRRHDLDIAVYVATTDGTRVIDEGWSDASLEESLCSEPGEYDVTARFPPILRPAEYVAGIWIGTEFETYVSRDVLRFTVLPHPHDRREAIERARAVQPPLAWTRSLLRTDEPRNGQ